MGETKPFILKESSPELLNRGTTQINITDWAAVCLLVTKLLEDAFFAN